MDGHRRLRPASRADVLRFSAGAALTGLAGVLYNYWMFGNAVGGAPFRTGYWVKELGTTSMFTGSLPVGFAGLTVSPSRGILIYSPIVLVAVYGAVRAWRSPLAPDSAAASLRRADALLLARYMSLAALAILLTYSKFIVWWGGHGYGPRYLTDAMPFIGPLFALRAVAARRPNVSRARRHGWPSLVAFTYSIVDSGHRRVLLAVFVDAERQPSISIPPVGLARKRHRARVSVTARASIPPLDDSSELANSRSLDRRSDRYTARASPEPSHEQMLAGNARALEQLELARTEHAEQPQAERDDRQRRG